VGGSRNGYYDTDRSIKSGGERRLGHAHRAGRGGGGAVTAPATRPEAARRILVCYDSSDEARRALERVAEIASAVMSRVTVISVAEPIYRNPPYTGYADPSEEEAHRRLLDEAVEHLRGRGVEAAAMEPVGQPADEIVDAARQRAVDLVVVGSGHHGLIRRLLPLSVSDEVVREAPCDVLVVR
jgi:nucleotide-binding universal stress UspA family protein